MFKKMYLKLIPILIIAVAVVICAQNRVTVPLKAHITITDPAPEAFPCITPKHEQAICISLFSCPGLMKALGTLDRSQIQHVHKSICPIGNPGELYVCCGRTDRIVTAPLPTPTPGKSTNKPTKKPTTIPPIETHGGAGKDPKKTHRDKVMEELIPSRQFCGLQQTDDRFYENNQTAVDEIPWLVHIKITDHEYEYEYGDRCSGVLISARYVLTDAYCAYHAIKVIVGEHKTDTNVSCTADSDLPDCTDPSYEIRVEEIIRDGKRENGPYDFALLRLNKTVTFSNFVRPLCLPFVESERPTKDETLTFSGWGSQGPGVVVKKRIHYEQTKDKECYDAEVGIEGNVQFANVSHLCVKAKKSQAHQACAGDHGGALTYSRKLQWFAEAIVINVFANAASCSATALASSIKILPKTLDWILDSMKL